MPALSLAELVQALTNAVVEAQNGVENQQIAMLSRFFAKDGRPACMPIMMPRMGLSGSDTDYTVLNVPLISLVEATMLHITEFEVSFDVELSGLGETAGDGLDHAPSPAPAPPSDVQPATAAQPAAVAQAAPVEPPAYADEEPEVAGVAGAWRRLLGGRRIVFPDIGPRVALEDAAPGPAGAAASPQPLRAQDPLAPTPGSLDDAAAPPTPAMIVGLGPKGAATPTAKATLKVSSRSMSDGMVRLLNHLNKTF